jgi:hypothetical protein
VPLVPLKLVRVKMLPFDNKSEFQVIINMPDGTPLEQTTRVAQALGGYLASNREVAELPDLRRHIRPLTISTAWCVTTICGASRTRPTSR